MRRLLPFLILLLTAAPAQAQSDDRTDRASAEKALAKVERLIDGRGHEKRGLTTALADLARSKAELGTADRRRANRILARPDDGTGIGAWTAPAADERSMCTAHFCVHWVTTTPDAPPTEDADADGVFDYIEFMAETFEQAYATEVGSLGWIAPLPDGGRGGSNLVDVYVSDIGDDAYGFAVPDSGARSTSSYLVLDNDYSTDQFPDYDDYVVPVEATAAHEFNHTLQFVYDNLQDDWFMESTATWAEEKVFDDANDYRFYLGTWATQPKVPISDSAPKMYGSAIWNHWLDGRYGAQVVRRAWAKSQANSVAGGGFAPGAYNRAIQDSCGPGFAFEFEDFTASVAEWGASNSGIREGSSFPPMVTRAGTLQVGSPKADTLDHTAFALYDVPTPASGTLYLTGGLEPETAGSIALVGRTPAGTMTKMLGILDADGRVTVALTDAGQYNRITAVVTNADVSHDGWGGSDWLWTKNEQVVTLTATTSLPTGASLAAPSPSFTPCTPVDAEPTPTPTPTPAAPPPPVRTSLGLSRSSTKLGPVARKGVLSFFARTNKAGRLTAKATVDRATASRLRVGRRTTTAGTGSRTATAPARLKVNVKLTRKLRAALKRHLKRAVRIEVRVTFVPADATGVVRRTITIKLRP